LSLVTKEKSCMISLTRQSNLKNIKTFQE